MGGIILLIFSSILLYSCHCDGFTGILAFHLLAELNQTIALFFKGNVCFSRMFRSSLITRFSRFSAAANYPDVV